MIPKDLMNPKNLQSALVYMKNQHPKAGGLIDNAFNKASEAARNNAISE